MSSRSRGERRTACLWELNPRLYAPVRTRTRRGGAIRVQDFRVVLDRRQHGLRRPAPGSDATLQAHPLAPPARPPLLNTAASCPRVGKRASAPRLAVVLTRSGSHAAPRASEHSALGCMHQGARACGAKARSGHKKSLWFARISWASARSPVVPRLLCARPTAHGHSACGSRSWAS